MDPITILSFVTLAMKVAPTVEKIAVEGGKIIKGLVDGGQVTVDQQNKVNAWADAHMAATLAGQVPPELVVD